MRGLILDAIETKACEVAQTLENKSGVRKVDILEGSPGLIVLIQARNRQQLADFTNKALASVEMVTDNWQLLPVQNKHNATDDA